MALSEGGNMSTYGKTVYNPYEQSSQWVEQIKREERIKATHKVLNGDEAVVATYFKGQKPDPGPDPSKNISYYNNYKERPKESLYERTFKVNTDYEPKLHRDDRHHKVGLDLHSEDQGKGVACVRTNSQYGARIHAPIDNLGVATTHAKRQVVANEFHDHGPAISNKKVTTTTTAEYGKRPPLETSSRQFARINIINKEFFRSSGNVLGQSS